MAKGLFHVSMIVGADALYAVTSAAASHKARDVQIQPLPDSAGKKSNGAAEPEPRVSLRTLLLPWMAKRKDFSMKEAIMFGSEQSYTKGAVYTACLAAMKLGLIQRTGPGDYKVLPTIKKAVKALADANGGSTHGNAKTQRAERQMNEIAHGDFVLQQISKGIVTYKTLREAFVADGRMKRSIDGAIARLKTDKLVANSGPGEYKLLAKGQEQLKSIGKA